MYKFLRNIVISITVSVYIFFEYFVWDLVVKPFIQYVKQFDVYNRILESTTYLNKYVLLFVFLGMFISSELLGLISLAWFAQGLIIPGVLMYVVKYLPAIQAFAILDYNKEELFTIKWFKRLYYFVLDIITKIKESDIYTNIRDRFTRMKYSYTYNTLMIKIGFIRTFVKTVFSGNSRSKFTRMVNRLTKHKLYNKPND